MKDLKDKLIEKQKEALMKIAFPLKYLQDEASKEGMRLDGVGAISLCKDANWLMEIAEKCLSDIASLEKQIEEQEEKTVSDDMMKCDVCDCHPSVIITTHFGRFCQQHAKY